MAGGRFRRVRLPTWFCSMVIRWIRFRIRRRSPRSSLLESTLAGLNSIGYLPRREQQQAEKYLMNSFVAFTGRCRGRAWLGPALTLILFHGERRTDSPG